jgi:replicative DNA helicase
MNIEQLKKINTKQRLLEQDLISQLFSNLSKTPKVMARLSDKDINYYKTEYNLFIDCYKNNKDPIVEVTAREINLSDVVKYFTGRPIEDICNEIKLLNNLKATVGLLESSIKNLNEDGLDEFISELQRKLVATNSSIGTEKSTADSVIAEYRELQEFYKERFKAGNKLIGLSTGYSKLDEIIDGLRKGHLWVLGGYTNMGKTAGSLNIASAVIKQGRRVVYYSLEMTKTDILSRLLGIMTNQSGLTILKGFEHNQESVAEAVKEISDSGMSIYNEKSELSLILSSMLEEHLTKPVDLFVIDFLQLINVKGAKSEYETVSTAILELQQTAKKMGVPIIVLSQISNEGARYNNDNVMSFKGSGSIASASDLAIEINVAEIDKDKWKIKMQQNEPIRMAWNVRKNRHGRVGCVYVEFTGRTGVFRQLTDSETIVAQTGIE